MANKHVDKQMLFTIVGCVLAGIVLIVMILVNFTGTFSSMIDSHSDFVSAQEQALVDEYAKALIAYSQSLCETVKDDEIVIGKPETEGTMFIDSLEAAGVDISRVHQTEDGVYVYRIKRGDTLASLSAAFDYSVDALANYNDIRNVNLIYEESALRIPNG